MKKVLLIAFLMTLIGSISIVSSQQQSKTVSREDSVITTDVKNGFTEDELLRGKILNVRTDKGIVTISGTVNSQADADRAMEIARKIPGVVSVKSSIALQTVPVSGDQTPTVNERAEIVEKGQKELDEAADLSGDVQIAAEVQAKFAADDMIKSRNLRINSTNGVITLRGTVRSEAEKQQAIDLANSAPGVKEVRSQIVVDPRSR